MDGIFPLEICVGHMRTWCAASIDRKGRDLNWTALDDLKVQTMDGLGLETRYKSHRGGRPVWKKRVWVKRHFRSLEKEFRFLLDRTFFSPIWEGRLLTIERERKKMRMQMVLSNEWSTLSKSLKRDGERDCVIPCRIVGSFTAGKMKSSKGLRATIYSI